MECILAERDARLDAHTAARLARLADARNQSAQGLMREAVQQYVEREEARERLCGQALAAWNAFGASGLHATAEEVDAWLAKLEAGEVLPPPACHG